MTRFHTDEYIDFLNKVTPETAEEMTGNGTRCESSSLNAVYELISLSTHPAVLVGEDNPAWDGLYEFCSISAGGSISAWLKYHHHDRADLD
jgi:histone deacetylase 1/2